MFDRTITIFQCTPCLVSKLKLCTVENFDPQKILSHTDFHFAFLDTIKQRLGGNVLVAKFIKPKT